MNGTDLLSQVDCFTYGAEIHAQWISERFGLSYQFQPRPIHPYRYFVGAFNMDFIRRAFTGGRVNILHWLGSDVLGMMRNKMFMKAARELDCIHWCDWYNLQTELKSMGIDADVVINEPRHRPVPSIPDGDMVAVYIGTNRKEFFHFDVIREVQKAIEPRNVVFLPRPNWPDIEDVFRNCSHYLRLCQHDGFSHLAAEFMMAGRTVVTNQSRPYQIEVEPTVRSVVPALYMGPHPDAPQFYRDLTDGRRFVQKLLETIIVNDPESGVSVRPLQHDGSTRSDVGDEARV